jgi:hypothetical protein
MNTQKYEDAVDKTFNAVNTVYSAGRRIGYVLMGVVFLIAGTGLIIWGYATVRNKIENSNYIKTEGTVIRMREVQSTEDMGITWAPVIRFKDRSGTEYTFESTVSSEPPAYNVGDKVELMYSEGRPENAFIDSFMEKWLTPIMLFVAGLVMFPIGIWMFFTAFRREKSVKSRDAHNSEGSSYISMG